MARSEGAGCRIWSGASASWMRGSCCGRCRRWYVVAVDLSLRGGEGQWGDKTGGARLGTHIHRLRGIVKMSAGKVPAWSGSSFVEAHRASPRRISRADVRGGFPRSPASDIASFGIETLTTDVYVQVEHFISLGSGLGLLVLTSQESPRRERSNKVALIGFEAESVALRACKDHS